MSKGDFMVHLLIVIECSNGFWKAGRQSSQPPRVQRLQQAANAASSIRMGGGLFLDWSDP